MSLNNSRSVVFSFESRTAAPRSVWSAWWAPTFPRSLKLPTLLKNIIFSAALGSKLESSRLSFPSSSLIIDLTEWDSKETSYFSNSSSRALSRTIRRLMGRMTNKAYILRLLADYRLKIYVAYLVQIVQKLLVFQSQGINYFLLFGVFRTKPVDFQAQALGLHSNEIVNFCDYLSIQAMLCCIGYQSSLCFGRL